MNVVHLELPRRFTLTVKEYQGEAAAALRRSGHGFRQYDLNPNFWRWLLGLSTPHSPRDCFGPLLAAADGGGDALWPVLAEVRAHLRDVAALYGVQFGFQGLMLPAAVQDSAYAMCALIADNAGCGLFANFFHHVQAEAPFLEADVISLGLEDQEGVYWALQMAAWLKAADSRAHITIARHSHENFSLVHHVADLARNDWFFGLIDSVVLYEEDLPETLTCLVERLAGASADALANIVIRDESGVTVHPPATRLQPRTAAARDIIPADYFTSMGIAPDQLVYAFAMVRNKCFYRKCTFCVQITKHLTNRAYAEPDEIQRALNVCAELQHCGVALVNFRDEAMRPVDLDAFCTGCLARGLSLNWVGRMVAAAHPSPDLLRRMRDAGCVEILFGLETFDPALARDMGKITGRSGGADTAIATVQTYLDAGLFAILSLIYGFPTENDAARERTLGETEELCRSSERLAFIFNRFALLHTSRLYQQPDQFNIHSVEEHSPENDLQYRFAYSVAEDHSTVTPQQLARIERLQLGLDETSYSILFEHYGDLLRMAYHLDYSSFGFRHRVSGTKTLLSHLFATTTMAL